MESEMKRFRLHLFVGLAGLLLGGLTALPQTPAVVNRFGSAKALGGPYEIYWQAVPTTLTALDTRDMRLQGYCVVNSTGSALTFTIQTRDSTPLPLPLSGSIAANSSTCLNIPFGLLSKGGVSVQASGAGLYHTVVWTH
jgi:hypothetical protein